MLGEKVIFSSVVKGNAYGHGIATYCPIAYDCGVRHFSVADAHEAASILDVLPYQDLTIMIMGMIENDELDWAISHHVEFYVFEKDRLLDAIEKARQLNIPAKIHLEVETGMNRTGFDIKTLSSIFELLKTHRQWIDVVGFCSHLAGAESIANYKRIKDQQKKFKKAISKLSSETEFTPVKHLASSAASIRYPKARYDMVRIGILQFGFFPTKEILVHFLNKDKSIVNPLHRIISWKTSVMVTKMIKEGQFVGYGTSYFTNHASKIAIIPVGYSSGYSRSLSNRGKVLINDKRFDIIGTVNMNMLAVDITTDTTIKKGDEVMLIGTQGAHEISVSSFNDSIQMINYELLTRLPENLPRVITQ